MNELKNKKKSDTSVELNNDNIHFIPVKSVYVHVHFPRTQTPPYLRLQLRLIIFLLTMRISPPTKHCESFHNLAADYNLKLQDTCKILLWSILPYASRISTKYSKERGTIN